LIPQLGGSAQAELIPVSVVRNVAAIGLRGATFCLAPTSDYAQADGEQAMAA
jgi:hypothetical protein